MLEGYLQSKRLRWIVKCSCSLSFLIEGYQAGILGGVQDTTPFLSAIGNPTGTYIIPMIASSYTLAAIVTSMAFMIVGMPLGRRNSILLGNVLVFIGGIIQAASFSVPQIIVARIICGTGIGLITCNVAMYMSEMSTQARERGPAVAISCSSLLAGVAMSYWIDFGFTRMTNQVSWRMPIAMQSIFAIIAGTGMFFCPDTPRWYYARGRYAEGDKTLARIYGVYKPDRANYDDHAAFQATKANIFQNLQIEAEQENRLSLASLVWDNTPLRVGTRIRLSFIILSIQQMMGIDILVYYLTLIFTQVGLSSFMSSLLAAISLTIQWTGSLVCIVTIERIGRRNIMLMTASVQSLCMIIFIVLNGMPNKTNATEWAAAIIMLPYLFMYGWGWVACPWLYGPEIAPLKYRHIGSAAGLVGEWLFTFITVFAGGIGVETVGWKIWIWPLIFNFLAVPFVYFFCPDPTGKTLEEIDALFARDGAIDHLPQQSDEKEAVREEIETAE